jgi:hypothetical protein
MIRYVGCDFAQAHLDAFADSELPMGDQVLVESHLRWCNICAARLEDLRTISASLRQGARVHDGGHARGQGSGTPAEQGVAGALAAMQAEVLAQIDTEYEQSLTVRVHELFSDMRLWWPALGASAAVALCVGLTSGVWKATSAEQPTSLAAMIENLADPGSNRNPLRLDSAMYLPRVIDEGVLLDGMMLAQTPGDSHGDDVVAVAAIVTREGTIGGYALLEQAGGRPLAVGVGTTTGDREDVLRAVRQSRFAPAQRPGVGAVAVNMVWLFARTTVKASHQAVDLGRPLTRPAIAPPAAVAKPASLPGLPAEGASSQEHTQEPQSAPMESATA